jgi:hypothetical protein
MFQKIIKIPSLNLYHSRKDNEERFRKIGANIISERINFLNNDSLYHISIQNDDRDFDNKVRGIWPNAVISSGSRGV